MSDYGHGLLFGTFITPVNGPAGQAVEQAVVAATLAALLRGRPIVSII